MRNIYLVSVPGPDTELLKPLYFPGRDDSILDTGS
jgi:hypothetical protein